MKTYIFTSNGTRLAFILIAVLTQLAAAQNKKGYVIKGNIDGLPENTKIYLTRNRGTDTVSKIISNNGKFEFIGTVPNGAEFYFIKIDTNVLRKPSKSILLMNSNIEIKSNLKEWPTIAVSGSNAHNDMVDMMNVVEDFKQKSLKLSIEGSKISKDYLELPKNDTVGLSAQMEKMSLVREQRNSLQKKLDSSIRAFISDKSTSYYTPYLISDYSGAFTTEEVKKMYNSLSSDAQQSNYGLVLKSAIEGSSIKAGDKMPEFEGVDVDGKVVKSIDIFLKSKITLIDCWASWCKPCREELPMLKAIFEKYKKRGFNILGVSSDKREADWKKALSEDMSTWSHLLDVNHNLIKSFSLSAIPAYILVDSKGKLIAFDCAMSQVSNFGGSLRGKSLDKILNDLFGK